MPIYEYRCRGCGHRFEALRRLGQSAEGLTCPVCGEASLEKQFSTFASATGSPGERGAAPVAGCGPGGFS